MCVYDMCIRVCVCVYVYICIYIYTYTTHIHSRKVVRALARGGPGPERPEEAAIDIMKYLTSYEICYSYYLSIPYYLNIHIIHLCILFVFLYTYIYIYIL